MEDDKGETEQVSTHDVLFGGDMNPITRSRDSLFSNTLILPGFNIYEALKIDDPKMLAWKEHSLDLRGRHLEQAVLKGADLTKADLTGAQLQGASLDRARLQGTQLDGAQLQRTQLYGAQLQGAALGRANLEGASLDQTAVSATDFSGAFLWRTEWGEIDPAKQGVVLLKDATWKPVLLADKPNAPLLQGKPEDYKRLQDSMNSIPEGEIRDAALKRIERLDCSNPDKNLASCDSAATQPRAVLDWQKKLAKVGGDDVAYAKALAKELRGLVCASDVNAIYILRDLVRGGIEIVQSADKRLSSAAREAPALVDYIMSKNCPVSTSLTDDDKANLLKIKQEAEKEFAPPPASNEEK